MMETAKREGADKDSELSNDLNTIDIREVTKLYVTKRAEFIALSKIIDHISRCSGGQPSTGFRMFYASVLFTRITVTSRTIEKLLPRPKPGQVWDFSSLASIVRNLVEAALTYHWLCGGDISDEERQGRYILLCLHDYGTRKKIFPDQFKAESGVFEDLKLKFEKNSYLSKFDERKKKQALRGDKTPYIQDDVLRELGGDLQEFRSFYRFLSEHTHTGPLSFFRMGENDLGVGVETRLEKIYAIFVVDCALMHLQIIVKEHLKIFPGADTATPFLSHKDIQRNVEIEQGRKSSKWRSKRSDT